MKYVKQPKSWCTIMIRIAFVGFIVSMAIAITMIVELSNSQVVIP